MCVYIIRAKPFCPSRKFVTFKLLHRWVPRLGRGTCVSEKQIQRVSSTRFGLRRLCRFCVTGKSPVFRIYSRLFCHAVAVIRDPLIVRAHSLCTACGIMPSWTRVHELPQRPHLLGAFELCYATAVHTIHTHKPAVLVGCRGVACTAHDCCWTGSTFLLQIPSVFLFILHVVISTFSQHLHTHDYTGCP